MSIEGFIIVASIVTAALAGWDSGRLLSGCDTEAETKERSYRGMTLIFVTVILVGVVLRIKGL